MTMIQNNTHQDIIQWGREYLLSHGYILINNSPEDVQNTPWSYVIRFTTSEGYIYLKHTPHLIALESKIFQVLHDQFHASVPEIVGYNTRLDCFLMKDAGKSLREILKRHFNADLFCKAVDQFTLMQVSVGDHVNTFIDIGVPDWRLQEFPDLFARLMTQKDLLMEDGLLEQEITKLEKLTIKVSHLCQELATYSIKETIVQPDFNDNNTLINETTQKMTIIDLGEISISHPFFSLLNGLHQMEKHYGIKQGTDEYSKILDACLKNFLSFDSRDNLLNALKLAYPLWFIYGALAGYRLVEACGKSKMLAYQPGKWVSSLRNFLVFAGD